MSTQSPSSAEAEAEPSIKQRERDWRKTRLELLASLLRPWDDAQLTFAFSKRPERRLIFPNLSFLPFHCYNCVVRKSKARHAMNLDFIPPPKNQPRSKIRMIRLKPRI